MQEVLRLLCPSLKNLFDLAPLARVPDMDESIGGMLEMNVISLVA